MADDFTQLNCVTLEIVFNAWGRQLVSKKLNKLEEVLVRGLKQEIDRLKSKQSSDRLNLPPNADNDAIESAYSSLIRNYHPKNYAKPAREVVEVAEELLSLLDDARNDLLGLIPVPEEDDEIINTPLTDMAFAATQASDDLPVDLEKMENEVFGRTPTAAPAVQPQSGPSSAPPPHFAAPPTPPNLGYGLNHNPQYGSQDIPGAYSQQAPQTNGVGYPTPPPPYSATPNYPPPPSWDLPPPPYNPAQNAGPLRSSDLVPPASYPGTPRTGDLPPTVVQAENRVRELTHRLYAAEAQIRSFARTSQEQARLLESQLNVAENRARSAELRIQQLERELSEARNASRVSTARPGLRS